MIAGHFGFAALVKSRARATPLWALMLACQALDVVFVPLFLAHMETLVPAPGAPPGYASAIIHADYTHSLPGALAISLVFGLLCAIPWGRVRGAILGGVVFSHFVLDLITHRPDLPLLPGAWGQSLPHLGLGLWRAPMLSAALELALVVAGAIAYARAATDAARTAGGARLSAARWASGVLFASGLVTLALDVFGG